MDNRIIDLDLDNRIIDLDLDNPILPDFFKNLKQPINMTLCAGDGLQFNLMKGELQTKITDIEWYTTSRQGFRREDKPTTIFITAKNYAPGELEQNKQYLRSHPELEVILLVYNDVYNDKIPKWKENLINLFPESINNIYEDVGCYGDKLDLKTLSIILREGGIYHMENYSPRVKKFIKELHDYYKDYWKYFTINLQEQPPYKIIKDNNNVLILPSGGKKKKTNKSKKTRKNNKTRKTKKRRKH